jgi:hypothetical protein
VSAETRDKIGAAHRGKVISEEMRTKLREAWAAEPGGSREVNAKLTLAEQVRAGALAAELLAFVDALAEFAADLYRRPAPRGEPPQMAAVPGAANTDLLADK